MSLQRDLPTDLRGRRSECAELDNCVEAAHRGDSRTVVLRGEAGIGKTAMLEYLAVRSHGCRVVRAVGIESEMELPFAAVHQLSQPLLENLERLPAPQRVALETAFGINFRGAARSVLRRARSAEPVRRTGRSAAADLPGR